MGPPSSLLGSEIMMSLNDHVNVSVGSGKVAQGRVVSTPSMVVKEMVGSRKRGGAERRQ